MSYKAPALIRMTCFPVTAWSGADGFLKKRKGMPSGCARPTAAMNVSVYASKHILAVSGVLIGAGAVLLGLSYALSMRIYSRREF